MSARLALALAAALAGSSAACSSPPERPGGVELTPPPAFGPQNEASRAQQPAARPAPAASSAPASAPVPADAASSSDALETASTLATAVVAVVGGREVPVDELLRLWWHYDPIGAEEHFKEVVSTQLALLEVARLGLRIAPEVFELRKARAREELARVVAKSGGGRSVKEYLRERRGTDPEAYFERLDEQTMHELVKERVVRAWQLSHERAIVRGIFTDDEDGMLAVRAELALGRSFEEVARELSIDPQAKEHGGLLPPVVRSTHSPLARLVFATPVGERAGPLAVDGRQLFLQVEAREPALEGDTWAALGAAVEASLAERPIDPIEYFEWGQAMLRRYPVDLSPFYQALGEPAG